MALGSLHCSVFLHFLLSSSFSNTQGCQLSKTDSPQRPASAVSFLLIIQCRMPASLTRRMESTSSSIGIWANWLRSFFWSPNFLSCSTMIKSSPHSLWSTVTCLILFFFFNHIYSICQTQFHKSCAHLSAHIILLVFNSRMLSYSVVSDSLQTHRL